MATSNPDRAYRRSLRLPAYDYSQAGAYFVTICTQNRECLFGEVKDGGMILNGLGLVVTEEWLRSTEIRREIELDEFIVMPNHLHGIILITKDCRGDRPVALPQTITETSPAAVIATGRTPFAPTEERLFQTIRPKGPKPLSLSSFIAGCKSAVTKRINEIRRTPGLPVWQRNYYEHVIRDETDLNKIREYIQYNPTKWVEDDEYPSSLKKATTAQPCETSVSENG